MWHTHSWIYQLPEGLITIVTIVLFILSSLEQFKPRRSSWNLPVFHRLVRLSAQRLGPFPVRAITCTGEVGKTNSSVQKGRKKIQRVTFSDVFLYKKLVFFPTPTKATKSIENAFKRQ